jgi:hypothetical protein
MVEPDSDNMVRRMSFACWVAKTTDTNTKYAFFCRFHSNSSYTAPQYDVYAYVACLVHTRGLSILMEVKLTNLVFT